MHGLANVLRRRGEKVVKDYRQVGGLLVSLKVFKVLNAIGDDTVRYKRQGSGDMKELFEYLVVSP